MRIVLFMLFVLVSTLSTQTLAQGEKLIFALDLIRHGDRSPIISLPKMPYDWPQGLGELSPTGMQQEYQLGASQRQRYIVDTPLLPPHYQAQNMYVRCSDYDRTLMSAESYLMGLYPLGTGPNLPMTGTAALPSNYQPIPIHTLPKEQDQLLVIDTHDPAYKGLLQKYVFSREDWKKKTAEYQPDFAHWSELTGIKITHLYQMITIGDTMLVRQNNHIPLPPGMTEKDEANMIEARNWAFAALFKPLELGQATGGKLLDNIKTYLKEASQHTTPLKYVLISGHDHNILSLLSALHLPQDKTPPYASDLNFALYQDAKGETLVKVSYNGEALILPACGKELCTLSKFVS